MAHTQQEELTNAIANVGVDGYETSESDDGDNMDHPMDDEFFDANDVFYDSVGRRISMRYSQAVYSHERHMPKLRVTSADSLARGPLKEEDEEEESEQDYVRSQQLRQAAHEARETDNDRVQVKEEAHNDGQPVADAHTQENNSHTTPSPATPRFTPLPQLPEDEYATSQPQSTPSPSANSSRASVRRSRSIDPVTLHIIKRTSLRMTQKQMAEVIVPVVTEEDAGIDEMGSEEAARASVDSGNANGYAGVQLNNDSGLSTGGLASGVLSTESLPGSRRGSVGSHLSGNAGEGSAEEKDGPEKDKGQRQKRSILSLMKFGRKRGATTVTPAPASDKLAPNTDEAEAAEEMRDSDELNGTVASASTLSVEHDLLPTATNISLASTASSGTVGGSPHTARYVKVKTKHKSAKSFPRLLLAQTLDTAALSAASGTSFSATSQSTASAPISTSPILSPATASTPQTTLAGSDAADPSLPLQGAIWTIKFSRDGKYLASGGQDFVVRVWAVFGTDVTPVAEKKDAGTGLASSGPEATTPDEMERDAKVFRDKPVHEYRGHTADVLDLSWSKNNFLLSSSMDKTVRLWHVSRKECLCVFPHLDFVTAIAFHPRDDRFFLSGSLDCKLRLWNIPEKKVAFWNEVPDDNLITAVGFTLDGKIACAGSYVGLCLFYETDGLRYNTQISVKDQKGRNSKKGRKITGIEPVPNMPPGEEKLLITSNDSRIRLVNMRDKSWECKYKGLENTSSQIKATFSDDGKYIICGSEDHSVYIWNTEQPGFVLPFHNDAHPQPTQTGLRTKSHGTALSALGEQALNAAVTPAGVPGNTTNRVGGWFKKREAAIAVPAPIREKLKGSFESFEAHNQIVTCAIFAPTKTKLLLAANGNDSVYANTPVPSVASATTSPSTSLPDPAYIPVNNNTAAYTYPDGDIIVTADYTGCIKVWRHDCASYIPPQMTGSSSPQSTLSASTAATVLNGNNSNGSLDAIATGKDAAGTQPTQTLSATLAPGDEHTPAKTRVGLGSIFYGRRKVDNPTKIADDHSAPPSPTTTGPAMTCSGCGGKEFKSFVAVPQTGGESGDVGEGAPKMEMQVCVGCNRVVAGL